MNEEVFPFFTYLFIVIYYNSSAKTPIETKFKVWNSPILSYVLQKAAKCLMIFSLTSSYTSMPF